MNRRKFKLKSSKKEWDFSYEPSPYPESVTRFVMKPNELGVTYINDLCTKDAQRVQKMARDEFASVAKKYKIDAFQKEKLKNTKTTDESGVFQIPLETLLEHDSKIAKDCDSPLILQMLILYLKHNGWSKQGHIFIEPGEMQGTHKLVSKLNRAFYAESPEAIDYALNKASGMEIMGVLKHFISRLPEPLLTNKFIRVFSHLDAIGYPTDQMIALKLLNLQLPQAHRTSLLNLLNLLSEVIGNDTANHGAMDNVAEAMAPFLFPLKDQNQIKAAQHSHLTKTMILNRNIMNTVPPFMLDYIRRKGGKLKQRMGPQLDKTAYDTKEAKMLIDWPDRNIRNYEINCTYDTTAYEIILRTYGENNKSKTDHNTNPQEPSNGPRFLSKLLATSYKEQCTMDPAKSSEFAIQLHSLFEVGGNIEFRRLRPDASVIKVFRKNPRVQSWVIRCEHLV